MGVFLSGGIDSPLVAAEMQHILKKSFKAFTIGLPGSAEDESQDAALYAEQIGLEHTIEELWPKDSLKYFDDVASSLSEPSADYSIFPTYVVSKLAASHVKVALSGDGGDEPFWGYPSRMGSVLRQAEFFAQSKASRLMRLGVKKLTGSGAITRDALFDSVGELVRSKQSILSEDFSVGSFPDLARAPVMPSVFDWHDSDPDKIAQYVRWVEWKVHLPRVLMKVDRASMQNSLEVRVPLLDKEVLDVASRIDWKSCFNLEKKIGKIPLRKCLNRRLSYETTKKKGFTVPIADWLLGPLKERFHDTVLADKVLCGTSVDTSFLAKAFKDLESGNPRYSWSLWSVFMLRVWEERHLKQR